VSDDFDWGAGDWWQMLPPVPWGDDDTSDEDLGEYDDWGFIPWDIPSAPDWGEFNPNDPWGDEYIPEAALNAWDFLTSLDTVNPADIRGVGFLDIFEAVAWLESLGLLGFSDVVEVDGLFYPVVGDSSRAE